MSRSVYVMILAVFSAQPLWADCGFCAREVTLSRPLAACYLERVEAELARVRELGLEVHLVELASCGATRGGNALPELPKGQEGAADVDESFLIPAQALDCLAKTLSNVDFGSENVKTFEVRVECND